MASLAPAAAAPVLKSLPELRPADLPSGVSHDFRRAAIRVFDRVANEIETYRHSQVARLTCHGITEVVDVAAAIGGLLHDRLSKALGNAVGSKSTDSLNCAELESFGDFVDVVTGYAECLVQLRADEISRGRCDGVPFQTVSAGGLLQPLAKVTAIVDGANGEVAGHCAIHRAEVSSCNDGNGQ